MGNFVKLQSYWESAFKKPCSQLEGRILWSGEDRVFQWFKGLPDEHSIWDDCAEREPDEEVEI